MEKADLVLKDARIVNVYGRDHPETLPYRWIIAELEASMGKKNVTWPQICMSGIIDSHLHLESGTGYTAELVTAAHMAGTNTFDAIPCVISQCVRFGRIDYILIKPKM